MQLQNVNIDLNEYLRWQRENNKYIENNYFLITYRQIQ